MPTVQNAVATKAKVGLGTALFLGVATAVTFSIGGAMFAAMGPLPTQSTTCYKQAGHPALYVDAAMTTVATGSCTIVVPTTETPYVVNLITEGTDYRQIDSSTNVPTYTFVSASNEQQIFGSMYSGYFNPRLDQPVNSAVAIHISIASPENILVIKTNIGTLNICVPKADQQNAKFFVGKSGTLYTDAALTTRATTEPCAVSLSRAATPTKSINGSRLQNSGRVSLGRTLNGYEELGVFSDSTFYVPWFGFIFPGSKAPLRVTVQPSFFPTPTFPVTTPSDILTVVTDVGTLNLCLPSRTYTTQADGNNFFAGKDGTLYEDMFLTKRATTEACSTILARAAVPTTVTAGSRLMNSGAITLSRAAGYFGDLGAFYEYGFNTAYSTSLLAGTKAPLRLTQWVSSSYSTPTFPVTLPADILTLTTDTGALNLCLPSRTYANEQDGAYLFAGKDGTLYDDAHLTKKATTETCSTILARAATPTSITAGTRTQSGNRLSLSRSAGYYGEMGAFYESGFTTAYGTTILAGSKAPLMVTHGVTYTYPEPTYPVTVPEDTLVLTTNAGTLIVCTPSLSYTDLEDGGHLFVGKDGSTYADALLQQSVKRCATPPREIGPTE